MPEAPVEKHIRKERKYLLNRRKVSRSLWGGVTDGNQSIGDDPPVELIALGHLQKKDQHIGGNDRRVDNRIVLARNGVANGYHEASGGKQNFQVSGTA
jgi:hypothetical protein